MTTIKTKLSMALLAAICLAPNIPQAQDAFRTEAEGDWYHPVDPQDWIKWGGNAEVISGVIDRIRNAEGPFRNADQPDTQIPYGPGNWSYEFIQAGTEAMEAAQMATDNTERRDALVEAMAYFHVASAPHTSEPSSIAALKMAEEAYAAASTLYPGTYERVELSHEGETFAVHLHLPPGDGPFPLLIHSNGSDQSKEMALGYYSDWLLPQGIAMISADMPGMGASRAFDITDGVTDKLLYEAALYAKSLPSIDNTKIFAQGSSFGGNLVTRLGLTRPDLELAGVAVLCGVLDSAFLAPPEAYEDLPQFTMDGVRSRLDLPLDSGAEDIADALRAVALGPYFTGPDVKTPFIVLQTNRDPVSPVEDLEEGLMQRASNVTAVKFDMPGHCIESHLENLIVVDWLKQRL